MTVDLLAAPNDVVRWAALLGPSAQLAERIADTEFVPAAMRGKPAVVAAAIMYGDEIGIGPMQALNSIHVVDGRPMPSAELMRAMIMRAGHTITVHEMTGTRVRVSGLRMGRPEAERFTVEWTLDMARAAGLLGKRNWQNYPRAMLTARATGDLARVVFPDVVKGLGYIAEDSDAEGEWWGPPEDTPPEPKTRKAIQRKRPPVAPPLEPSRSPVGHRLPAPDPGHTYNPETDPEQPPLPVGLDNGVSVVVPPSAMSPALSTGEKEPTTAEPPFPPSSAPPVLPDEMQPEQTPPEPTPGVKLITPAPLRALHTALTRELGTAGTREEKLALIGAILGRDVDSTKNLTRPEGYRALDFLARVAEGQAQWHMDGETGAISVSVNDPN